MAASMKCDGTERALSSGFFVRCLISEWFYRHYVDKSLKINEPRAALLRTGAHGEGWRSFLTAGGGEAAPRSIKCSNPVGDLASV